MLKLKNGSQTLNKRELQLQQLVAWEATAWKARARNAVLAKMPLQICQYLSPWATNGCVSHGVHDAYETKHMHESTLQENLSI